MFDWTDKADMMFERYIEGPLAFRDIMVQKTENTKVCREIFMWQNKCQLLRPQKISTNTVEKNQYAKTVVIRQFKNAKVERINNNDINNIHNQNIVTSIS